MSGAEGPVRLIKWFLNEKKRPFEFGSRRRAQSPVAGAKLGLEMVAIFFNNVVEGDNGFRLMLHLFACAQIIFSRTTVFL